MKDTDSVISIEIQIVCVILKKNPSRKLNPFGKQDPERGSEVTVIFTRPNAHPILATTELHVDFFGPFFTE